MAYQDLQTTEHRTRSKIPSREKTVQMMSWSREFIVVFSLAARLFAGDETPARDGPTISSAAERAGPCCGNRTRLQWIKPELLFFSFSFFLRESMGLFIRPEIVFIQWIFFVFLFWLDRIQWTKYIINIHPLIFFLFNNNKKNEKETLNLKTTDRVGIVELLPVVRMGVWRH